LVVSIFHRFWVPQRGMRGSNDESRITNNGCVSLTVIRHS
jgi:hypothetical protein